MEIRLLEATDDRDGFRSGDPDLDRFLQKYSRQNQFRHHVGVTYVAVEAGKVLGYATVSPGQVEIEELPAKSRKSIPKYPLPILRLGRLAVDASVQGQGLGKELLRFVMGLSVRLSIEYGCVGIIVDAKSEAVGFYEKLGFLPLELLEGRSEARPLATAMFLPIAEIKAASRPRESENLKSEVSIALISTRSRSSHS